MNELTWTKVFNWGKACHLAIARPGYYKIEKRIFHNGSDSWKKFVALYCVDGCIDPTSFECIIGYGVKLKDIKILVQKHHDTHPLGITPVTRNLTGGER